MKGHSPFSRRQVETEKVVVTMGAQMRNENRDCQEKERKKPAYLSTCRREKAQTMCFNLIPGEGAQHWKKNSADFPSPWTLAMLLQLT